MSTRSTETEPILVVGRGRLGASLVRALRASGAAASSTAGRAPGARALSASAVIVLAVPDPALASLAARVARSLRPGAVVLHVAGGLGRDVLAPCRAAGADVGVMHPLVSFASARRAPPLAGATFVIDGDPRAVRAARAITRALGARALVLPLHGPAYHAVAALLANGAAALAALSVDALVALGSTRGDAERASAALLGSVASNIASIGLPAALTGPIVRGDALSVARHREALAELDRGALAAYDAVAPAILEVAQRAGLDARSSRAVRAALGAAADGGHPAVSEPARARRSTPARRSRRPR